MRRASIQEVHQPVINEYLAEIAPTYSHNTSVLLGIFEHTLYLAFIPDTVHRVLYMRLVAAEKATFEKPYDEMLACGHLATEHWKALTAVWIKMQPELAYN